MKADGRGEVGRLRPVAIDLGFRTDMEEQLLAADRFLLQNGWAKPGEPVVVIAAIPLAMGKETNTIRLHRVRDVS